VTVPKATFFAQSMAAEEESSELPPPAVFSPAQLKRPAGRPRRMPRVDEMPIPAQNEIRARGERFDPQPVRPMTLLQRLAAVGLGGHDREEAEVEAKHLLTECTEPRMPRTEPCTSEPDSRDPRFHDPQGLGMQGGSRSLAEEADEDQLDIPHFLRWQAD
jgi:cell division protein FtsZ